MFSSDVSWGMNDEKDEINDKIPTYSVVLLGDSQVGKTQILNQKSNFQFNEEYEVTMDVVLIMWKPKSNKTIPIKISN
jgi:GTPase SAR1 family protein